MDTKPIYSSESGITLIQMAMILVIISIMMVPFFQLQDLTRKNELRSSQKIQAADIAESLVQFALKNGRYPLPANPNFALNNVSSGVEQTVTDSGVRTRPSNTCHAGTPSDPANSNDKRACVDGSNMTTPPYPIVSGLTPAENAVIIGTVPYAILGFNPAQSLDQFGNKFTYAVTYGLTKTPTFNNNKGNIAVRDQVGGNFLSQNNPTTSAHFVVISHGQNRKGAFPGNGGGRESCAAGTSLLSAFEIENCDIDSSFVLISNRPPSDTNTANAYYATNNFIQPGQNVVGGFDDIVEYRTSVNSGNWTSQKIGTNTYQTYFSYRKGDDNVVLGSGDMSFILNATSTLSRGAGQVQVENGSNVKAMSVITDYVCSIKNPGNNVIDSTNKARACVKLRYLTTNETGLNNFGSQAPVNKIAASGFACSSYSSCLNAVVNDGYNRLMEVSDKGTSANRAGLMNTTARSGKEAEIPPSSVRTISGSVEGSTPCATSASGIDSLGRIICD